jgi:hypothetical protein
MSKNNEKDPRFKKIDYDLNHVDFEWVANCTDKKELNLAYNALVEDGYFTELMAAAKERLMEIDPSFKRRILSEKVSKED